MNLTFGSDPEFFASYKQDGKDYVIPPVFFKEHLGVKPVKDEAKHPEYIHTSDGVIIHQDGVAFEFKIPPVKTPRELKTLVDNGLDALQNFVGKFGYDIYTKPTINFDTERFQGEGEYFRECLIFGCDRDWDAFNYFNYNSPEIDASLHAYRYGGGHLHLSGEEFLGKFPLAAIKLLALYVGNYFVSKTPYPELEKQRVFLYGRPGKFRPQDYGNGIKGVEYRTPSNSWLSSIEIVEGIFEHAIKAVEKLIVPAEGKRLIAQFSDDTIEAIMNCNKEKAVENLQAIG